MCYTRTRILPCAFGEGDTVCVCLMRSDDVRQLVILQEVIDGSRTKTGERGTETDTCMYVCMYVKTHYTLDRTIRFRCTEGNSTCACVSACAYIYNWNSSESQRGQ